MAPPQHRRPGFSRRAQYGLFAGYVIATVGVVVAFGLLLLAHVNPRAFATVRGVALDTTAPLTAAGRSMVDGVAAAGRDIGAYWDAGSRNRAMARELASARGRLIAARIQAFENRRLRQLVRLADRTPETVVATRVIGSTASGSRRLATIAAGHLRGVRPGQPVRAPEGLVGRVFETGNLAARLLLTDSSSAVPVRLVRNGLPALASGTGDGRLRVRPLIAGVNPFRRGDLLVTSGTGGIYPPNVPVAVVIGQDALTPLARPLADPAGLDYVIVQQPYAPEAALPPPGLPTTGADTP